MSEILKAGKSHTISQKRVLRSSLRILNTKSLSKLIDVIVNDLGTLLACDMVNCFFTVNTIQHDVFYKHALKIATSYFNRYKNIDFLFGSVIKYKLLYGYRPWKIYWSFGFYTTHSIGFFIRKKSQMKVGLYKLKYRYSSDYDLFYRLIVKHKMKGMATKKNEIFGKFRRGGISSKLSNNDFLREIYKVRVGNGQNKIFVLFLLFLKYSKYNLKKILKL